MRFRLGGSKPTPLPPELDQPEVLAFVAAMLAWRDGDEPPRPPTQLTMTVPELMARLQDPAIRRGIVERLKPLVQQPGKGGASAREKTWREIRREPGE